MRPVCLDLTRLVSRHGRGPDTGIDRVERAWLAALFDMDGPAFGLVRTRGGLALLDATGLSALNRFLAGQANASPMDTSARGPRGLIEAGRAVRAASLLWRPRMMPGRVLRGLPDGTLYLNLGHSNLTRGMARAIARAPNVRAGVMIHDLIPLSHPRTQAAGGVKRFERKLAAAFEMADRFICPSVQSAHALMARFGRWGERPTPLVAPLAPGLSDCKAVRPQAAPARYFVALGTIEPRKNLGFLLDLMEELGPEAPHLVIIGRRGWETPDFLARLDAMKARTPQILEFNDLSDAEVAGWLAGAEALLHPSIAEGFGLPPAEAIALGTPAVCAPLPVYREILGDLPIYAELDDRYHWKQILLGQIGVPQARTRIGRDRAKGLPLPTWSEHVNRVLRALA